MGYDFWLLLLVVVLMLVITVIRLVRKDSPDIFRVWDWGYIIPGMLGALVIGELLGHAMIDSNITNKSMDLVLMVTVPALVLIFIMMFFIFSPRVWIKKFTPLKPDERLVAVRDKSARNALIATYIAIIVFIFLGKDTLDRSSLMTVVAGGELVLMASYFFYFFRKS